MLVALSPYFLYQALRHNKYVGSFGQRLGYLPVSFNLDGEESIWVLGAAVSTRQVKEAGLGSALPAPSIALTSKLWLPSLSPA